jgi:Putative zinc-finger
MTATSAGGPTCREIRQLLGVYVVGAIDPAERALVDEHLSECAFCRDELAGLAGLPAMLSRVPAAELERMGGNVVSLPDPAEPSPELLNSLLRRVAVRRRTRMWRAAASVAAAAVIAAGGTAAGLELISSSAGVTDVASGVNATTHVWAKVDYSKATWGSAMRVQVTGIKPGTVCKFWVITKSGMSYAGSWMVGSATPYGSPWYSASSRVTPTAVHAFEITSGGQVLVTVPAT